MAGHSKWANTKHRKAGVDAKRNRIFTKIMREIMVATREGKSGDVEANPRLRSVVLKARVANMPRDNIEKAIKKGLGESTAEHYDEILYEGYTQGIALMINALTNNKNRTASDLRSLLIKNGATLGTSGSASRLFQRKGVAYLSVQEGEDALIEVALMAGAQDVVIHKEVAEIISDPRDFDRVLEALQSQNWEIYETGIQFIPLVKESLEKEKARKVLALIQKLEDLEDVQSVEHNLIVLDDWEEEF